MRGLIVLAFAAAAGLARVPDGTMRVLILSGQNNHDWRTTTPHLRQLLDQAGNFRVRVTEEPAGLTPEILANYDVLVSDYNGGRWNKTAEAAVEQFVKQGGGLVAVHAADYAFGTMEVLGDRHVRTGIREPEWTAWRQMIGGSWVEGPPKSGHGKRHCFQVKWTDPKHPIAAGQTEFTACDELYHRLRIEPNVQVLATAYDDPAQNGTGKEEPLLWTVNYGLGRVFHTGLGHDVAAMQTAGFAGSFVRGVAWAAAGAMAPRQPEAGQKVRAMVVVGGHDHDTSFYGVFEGAPGIKTTVNPHPTAFRKDMVKAVDVAVLYDLVNEIPADQKAILQGFLESGKGLVVVHHAIADYNSWEWWWREVVGGRYLLKPLDGQAASTFKHDVEMNAKVVAEHPVVKGIPPFRILDETYKGMWISPKSKVLLRTDEATSDGPLVWISPYEKSRVVYIQLGHGRDAHEHQAFRQLVRNAVLWSAGKL
ncbi:MAG: ThuA domain-containing protein [Bryobacterales bacterium]|nr:ThuA domain-containing protein [Bryobacterales bacterium]